MYRFVDRFTFIFIRLLIQNAVTFVLEDVVNFELDFPNDLWCICRNSVDHLDIVENFKNAVGRAYHVTTILECRNARDVILDDFRKVPESQKHLQIIYSIRKCSIAFGFPEIASTNLFKFMTVITDLCLCWKDEEDLVSFVLDMTALCLCSSRSDEFFKDIDMIDKAASEYLGTR